MQKVKILKSFQTYADAQDWATKILPNKNFSIHETNVIKSMSKGRGRIPSGRYHVVLKNTQGSDWNSYFNNVVNSMQQSGKQRMIFQDTPETQQFIAANGGNLHTIRTTRADGKTPVIQVLGIRQGQDSDWVGSARPNTAYDKGIAERILSSGGVIKPNDPNYSAYANWVRDGSSAGAVHATNNPDGSIAIHAIHTNEGWSGGLNPGQYAHHAGIGHWGDSQQQQPAQQQQQTVQPQQQQQPWQPGDERPKVLGAGHDLTDEGDTGSRFLNHTFKELAEAGHLMPIPHPTKNGEVVHTFVHGGKDFSSKHQVAEERHVVLMNVNGQPVPFYHSTGAGGKDDVESGRWYPFFGIGEDGWINKTKGQEINNYYGSPELRRVAEMLDSSTGDIRTHLHGEGEDKTKLDGRLRTTGAYDLDSNYEYQGRRISSQEAARYRVNPSDPTSPKKVDRVNVRAKISDYIHQAMGEITSASHPKNVQDHERNAEHEKLNSNIKTITEKIRANAENQPAQQQQQQQQQPAQQQQETQTAPNQQQPETQTAPKQQSSSPFDRMN
jgi:hypothetical protein